MSAFAVVITCQLCRYRDQVSKPQGDAEVLRVLAVLDDPSRRSLYEAVRAADRPVTREQAAAAVGISGKLAAFHLDKLVAAGLLEATYDAGARRRTLGRTPKAYRPSTLELRFSLPERRPEALAELLVDAVTSAGADESPRHAALRAAETAGQRLGAGIRAERRTGRLGAERALTIVEDVLRRQAFEPARVTSTCIRLRNCPYQPLATRATELVCGMNEQFMTGLLRGLDARSVEAVVAPTPDACCVELRSR
jgi:predicted ArsR family transcriptional regulator